jgi:curli production assembly/transport component CsgF
MRRAHFCCYKGVNKVVDNDRNVSTLLFVILFAATSSAFGGKASAQQLVYTPINPAFGGNPFNSTQLEADASAQNPYKNSGANAVKPETQAQLFASELQSQLLGDLANQVSNAIFGPNAQNQGTFSFGGESVTFVRALGQITVTITDPTGAQTVIQLPTTSSTGSGGG